MLDQFALGTTMDVDFTITGLTDAVVTYNTGSGSNTVILVGGTATITESSVTSDMTITVTNISDGACNTCA